MIVQTLTILLLLAQATPAAPSAPTPAPAAAATPAVAPAATPEAPVDPVTLEINRLMEAWKGKSGDTLRGRLGLSTSSRKATDGEVVFWTSRSESMACGADAAGELRCGAVGGAVCMLGIAFDPKGKVKSWKASGDPQTCRQFTSKLGAPT